MKKMSSRDVLNPVDCVDSVKKCGNYFHKRGSPIEINFNAAMQKSDQRNILIDSAILSHSMYYSHFTLTAPIFKSRFQSSTYLQEEAYGTRK
ncbi:MAG: hypothetical protein C4288_10680 [Leptolyngbya sp. ERB_1_1]